LRSDVVFHIASFLQCFDGIVSVTFVYKHFDESVVRDNIRLNILLFHFFTCFDVSVTFVYKHFDESGVCDNIRLNILLLNVLIAL